MMSSADEPDPPPLEREYVLEEKKLVSSGLLAVEPQHLP